MPSAWTTGCAFNEGWGLYAERLADEIGLYSSPVARLGMLSFASLRACRLVVDTGMHQLGWSRRQAMRLTIIGAGAIGGTLGAHLIRAGHDITLCDSDQAHVAAIREHGLNIEGPVNEFTVQARAIAPAQLPSRVGRAIVAVKSLHTRAAADLLRDRLAPDGYVLTVQNGLTAGPLVEAVGRDRVVSSFVNFGADVMAPGRIMQGNVATFRVGELDGGRITARVRDLAAGR